MKWYEKVTKTGDCKMVHCRMCGSLLDYVVTYKGYRARGGKPVDDHCKKMG